MMNQQLQFVLNDEYGLRFWQTFPALFTLVDGESYTVKWDGRDYVCTAEAMGFGELSGIGLGNKGIVGIGENTGEPFIFAYMAEMDANAAFSSDHADTTHTVSLGKKEEPVACGTDIMLYDRNGEAVVYHGIETITTNKPDTDEKAMFTYGAPLDEEEITLDMAEGDQKIVAPSGYVIRSATIKKPETLEPENIAEGVVIAGVTGTHKGGGTEEPLPWQPEIVDDVRFYDMDGSIVFRCSVQEANALEALPVPPPHDGFTFQEWNHTLEEVKTTTHALDIGANYITSDGKTVVVNSPMEIDLGSQSGTVKVNFYQSVSAGVRISVNGAAETTVSGTGNVSLSVSGWSTNNWVKTITFDPQDGCDFYFRNFTGFSGKLGSLSTTITPEAYKIDVGKNYTFGAKLSKGYYTNIPTGLASVTTLDMLTAKYCYVPRTVTEMTQNPYASASVLSLPRMLTTLPSSISSNAERLILPEADIGTISITAYYAKYIYFPDNVSTISNLSTYNARKIRFPTSPCKLTRISYWQATEIRIPQNITPDLTSNYFFNDCNNLRKVTWECELEKAAATGYVFNSCYKLSKLTLPKGVTSVSGTFGYKCTGVDSIVFPEGVTTVSCSLGSDTMYGLELVVFPSTIKTISSYMLNDQARNARGIVCLASTPPDAGTDLVRLFYGESISYRWIVYVPDESLELYRAATSNENYKNRLKPLSEYPGGFDIEKL